jgi:hypothetical protein
MKNRNFNALLKGAEKLLGKHFKCCCLQLFLAKLRYPTTGHYFTIYLKPSEI